MYKTLPQFRIWDILEEEAKQEAKDQRMGCEIVPHISIRSYTQNASQQHDYTNVSWKMPKLRKQNPHDLNPIQTTMSNCTWMHVTTSRYKAQV